jgi:hypothetical protein
MIERENFCQLLVTIRDWKKLNDYKTYGNIF